VSNQEVGRTNKEGNLLVPNLLSYYGNILNISDQDVPLDNSVAAYDLYRDAARTTIWGDGTGSTATYTQLSVPNNTAQNLTIYGRISAAQDVRAGTYTDSVTVTIDF
jgi:outer membrane usher protein FimD/PapC